MKRFQCPLLEAYDAIMDWAEFATSEPSFDFSLGSVGNKRGSVVAALTKKMGMKGLRPFVSEVVVPTQAKPVDIVRFRFSHALDSMFSDRSLMKPPNLVINQPPSGKDPYALYESPGNLLNKIHSGSSFQNAYWYKIKDPSCQFLIFLIFFIDKTGIDGMQRFGLEPLRFTLSIFKRGVHVHGFAWTPIRAGSLQREQCQKQTTQTCKCRLTSWHCCMVFATISLRFVSLFSQLCRVTNFADFTFAWTKY